MTNICSRWMRRTSPLPNPNTATAPIFRTRRDAELTKAIYARLPVLVDKSKPGPHVKAWPVEYPTACLT